jgi:hypothetical protein
MTELQMETDEQIFKRIVDQRVLRLWVEAKVSPGTLPSNLRRQRQLPLKMWQQTMYRELSVGTARQKLEGTYDVAAYRRTHEHYSKAQTEAALSALAELGNALEPYHDDVVLIGGLLAYLLTKGFFDHCGSNDIDLLVKPSSMQCRGDTTIREILTSLNYNVVTAKTLDSYSSPENPNSFSKTDDKGYPITLNFMCEKTSRDDDTGQVPIQEGLSAMPSSHIRDVEGIFNSEGEPSAQNHLRVLNLPGLLALKSAVGRPKDYYDIFALTHCDGGPQQAAELFNHSIRKFYSSKQYWNLLKVTIEVMSREFKTGSSTGAHFVEVFDKKQKSEVVAKQVTRFIEHVCDDLLWPIA